MLLAFSAVAVALTAIGLYGLTSFVVAARRREVGIRRAFGAESRHVVSLFVRRGMRPVLVGAAMGVASALVGSRLLSSLVFGVATSDTLTIVTAVLGFTLVALGAILVATRAAARLSPMEALRAD